MPGLIHLLRSQPAPRGDSPAPGEFGLHSDRNVDNHLGKDAIDVLIAAVLLMAGVWTLL